jgi:predicted nucleic acid-binding protein
MAGDAPLTRIRYVVDASVAVKLYLSDEDEREAATLLFDDFLEDRVELAAPEQIRFEVPSAIRKGIRTNRLTLGDVRIAIREFLSWPIVTSCDDALILAACERSVRFGCSFYDRLYVALAQSLGCQLIHADRRLSDALGTRADFLLWLGDYPSIRSTLR